MDHTHRLAHIYYDSDTMRESRVQLNELSKMLANLVHDFLYHPVIAKIVNNKSACPESALPIRQLELASDFLKELPKDEICYGFKAVKPAQLEMLTTLEETCNSFASVIGELQQNPALYKKTSTPEQAAASLSYLVKSLRKCQEILFEHGDAIMRYAATFCPYDLADFKRAHPEIRMQSLLQHDAAYVSQRETEELLKTLKEAGDKFPPLPAPSSTMDRKEVPLFYKALIALENDYALYALMQRRKGGKSIIHAQNVSADVDRRGQLRLAEDFRALQVPSGPNYQYYDLVVPVADKRNECVASLISLYEDFGLAETQIHDRFQLLEKVASQLTPHAQREQHAPMRRAG